MTYFNFKQHRALRNNRYDVRHDDVDLGVVVHRVDWRALFSLRAPEGIWEPIALSGRRLQYQPTKHEAAEALFAYHEARKEQDLRFRIFEAIFMLGGE